MEIRVCKPENPSGHIVWIHENNPSELWNLLNDTGVTLICVTDADWNRDLSPWPAEKVFRGADFAGGASEHLADLLKSIPDTEESLGPREIPHHCRVFTGGTVRTLGFLRHRLLRRRGIGIRIPVVRRIHGVSHSKPDSRGCGVSVSRRRGA